MMKGVTTPKMEASEANVKSALTNKKPALSTSAAQKTRTQPLPVKPATAASPKQTKHKKANPNSNLSFNHRAHFTKFKRRIHQQRQWVLEKAGGRGAQSGAAGVRSEAAAVSSRSVSSSSDFTEQHASDEMPEDEAVMSRKTPSSSSSSATALLPMAVEAKAAVGTMDALFRQLDASMKQRRFGRAAFLKHCLRARRHQLRRELLRGKVKNTTAAVAVEAATASSTSQNDARLIDQHAAQKKVDSTRKTGDSEGPTTSPSIYRSFHPPSTWLGVGRHPRSDWVDQRSGRYPAACSQEQIRVVLRGFTSETPAGELDIPEDYRYMIPAAPSTPAAAATLHGTEDEVAQDRRKVAAGSFSSAAARPLSSTAALSRAQRRQASSLFVAAYARNVLTDTLDDLCFTLLQGLYKEQRALKQKQPLQFKARQRYVVGFQEVLKCMKAGRVKLVLLAADVEAVDVVDAELRGPSETPLAETATAAPTSKHMRKKVFQSLYEAVTQVQQLCSAAEPTQRASAAQSSRSMAANDNNSGVSTVALSARVPPLCVSCMSRQRLAYALFAKNSNVACVGVMQAEKNRDAFKAVLAYGRLLTQVYADELMISEASGA